MVGQNILAPFPTFFDKDGTALENGHIFIGESGLNPETSAIDVFWDKDSLYPAAQPIRTINGLPSRSGTPSAIYTKSQDYSMLVQDKNNQFIYSASSISGLTVSAFMETLLDDPDAPTALETLGAIHRVDSISDLRAYTVQADSILVDYHTTEGDNRGGFYYWNATSTATDNDSTIIKVTTVGTGRWIKLSDRLSPGIVNSLTWAGADLNARMTVADGWLYCCEFTASKIAVFDLSDPANPVYVRSYSVDTNPRHVDIIGKYMVVTGNGADTIKFYDIYNPSTATLVGTISTADSPKMTVIKGNELYVACAGTSHVVEKYRFTLPENGAPFSSVLVKSQAVSTSPISIASNGAGMLAVSGLSTDVDLLSMDDALTVISQTTLGGTGHGSCIWATKTQLLITDVSSDSILSVDCSTPATPTIDTTLAVSTDPEQIFIVGELCYVPSLTSVGVQAFLDVLDISDAKVPTLIKSVPLTVTGAGFVAYYNNGDKSYIYVNGHFTPFNIDVIEVDGREHNSSMTYEPEEVSFQAPYSQTWTPVLMDDTLSASEGQTYAAQEGTYMQIGNLVMFKGRIKMTSLGTLTSGEQAHIGLPITSASSGGASSVYCGKATNISTAHPVSGVIEDGAVAIDLWVWDTATGGTIFFITEMTSAGELYFSGSYYV